MEPMEKSNDSGSPVAPPSVELSATVVVTPARAEPTVAPESRSNDVQHIHSVVDSTISAIPVVIEPPSSLEIPVQPAAPPAVIVSAPLQPADLSSAPPNEVSIAAVEEVVSVNQENVVNDSVVANTVSAAVVETITPTSESLGSSAIPVPDGDDNLVIENAVSATVIETIALNSDPPETFVNPDPLEADTANEGEDKNPHSEPSMVDGASKSSNPVSSELTTAPVLGGSGDHGNIPLQAMGKNALDAEMPEIETNAVVAHGPDTAMKDVEDSPVEKKQKHSGEMGVLSKLDGSGSAGVPKEVGVSVSKDPFPSTISDQDGQNGTSGGNGNDIVEVKATTEVLTGDSHDALKSSHSAGSDSAAEPRGNNPVTANIQSANEGPHLPGPVSHETAERMANTADSNAAGSHGSGKLAVANSEADKNICVTTGEETVVGMEISKENPASVVDSATAIQTNMKIADVSKGSSVNQTGDGPKDKDVDMADADVAVVHESIVVDEVEPVTPVPKEKLTADAQQPVTTPKDKDTAVGKASEQLDGRSSARANTRRASKITTPGRMTRSGRQLGNGAVRSSVAGKDPADGEKGTVGKVGSAPARSTRASTAGKPLRVQMQGPSNPTEMETGVASQLASARVAKAANTGRAPADNMSVEARLRKELQAAKALIEAQEDQIEELTQTLQEERTHLSDLIDAVRTKAEYSHQVARLVRVFRELNVRLPPLNEADWDARAVAQAVRDTIKLQLANSGEWSPAAEQRAYDLIRILLGARTIQPGEEGVNTIKLSMRNDDLDRDMSFWLHWNDTNVRYTRIHMNVPEVAAPEFASEVSIDFDVRQGPHFLFQLLSALFHQS